MFPVKRKVPRELFPIVYKHGTAFHSKHIQLKILDPLSVRSKQTFGTKGLFSFVVSRKVAKNATDRNALKRRCYGVLSHALNGVDTQTAGIFYLKKGITEITAHELEKEILFLLNKAKII